MNEIPPELADWGAQTETRILAARKRAKVRRLKAWRCLGIGFATGTGFGVLLAAGLEILKK